jgi:hypothetical protein
MGLSLVSTLVYVGSQLLGLLLFLQSNRALNALDKQMNDRGCVDLHGELSLCMLVAGWYPLEFGGS